MNRKAISTKMRFAVFKRDNFTCQYCGRKAPDVVLEIDHINPISNGGDNSIINYITSCFECNRGKGKEILSENTILEKQRNQLEILNNKREQMMMMVEWKNEIQQLEYEEIEQIEILFFTTTQKTFSTEGSKIIGALIKKYSFNDVYDATIISLKQYYDPSQPATSQKAFDYIARICWNRKYNNDHRKMQINYLKKVAKSHIFYINEKVFKEILYQNYKEDDFEQLKDICKKSKNWTILKETLNDYYKE